MVQVVYQPASFVARAWFNGHDGLGQVTAQLPDPALREG